ncbi:MAG: hypothetical protein NZ553_08990 [Caldilinea sp.]|nr:hypothetical protein [Caldilinea sp.]MDW8440594.1 hypothetical protein [Caldilineaceae bacterium]
MEANQPTTPNPESTSSQAESGADTNPKQTTQELLDELAEAANRLVSLGKSWWNSEQRKQLEENLRTGAETIVSTLESSFQKVASSQEAKELQAKAGEVGEKVASSKVVNELLEALTKGLHALSEQLEKAAQELEAKKKAESSTTETTGEEPASQEIPVDKA